MDFKNTLVAYNRLHLRKYPNKFGFSFDLHYLCIQINHRENAEN